MTGSDSKRKLVALVTGGAAGIGQAIANRLAQEAMTPDCWKPEAGGLLAHGARA